jgi:hypothetical protein
MVSCIQFIKCHPVLGSCHMICFHPYGVWGVNILAKYRLVLIWNRRSKTHYRHPRYNIVTLEPINPQFTCTLSPTHFSHFGDASVTGNSPKKEGFRIDGNKFLKNSRKWGRKTCLNNLSKSGELSFRVWSN